MNFRNTSKKFIFSLLCLLQLYFASNGQSAMQWAAGVNLANKTTCFYDTASGGIVKTLLPMKQQTYLATAAHLTPQGWKMPLQIWGFTVTPDESKVLIYTNAKKVWRRATRGDYWIFEGATKQLRQLGRSLPEASLMFAKCSPDGQKVAYVSGHNLYVEDLKTGKILALTTDGTDRLINGTFDWVYEEEFDCRDGFRWAPDSKNIAYWQIDARKTRDFLMINNTDSIYPFTIPVQYPKVGEPPSPFRIGVVNIDSQKTNWITLPVDPTNSFLPRMEWMPNSASLILQHVNRKQNNTVIYRYDTQKNEAVVVYREQDSAWIDMPEQRSDGCWLWLKGGKEFLLLSEKSGWRHIYKIGQDGAEQQVSSGNFDVMEMLAADEAVGRVYACTSDSTGYINRHLRAFKLDGTANHFLSYDQWGTHNYNISPDGKFAFHTFSNYYTSPLSEWISLPEHKPLKGETPIPMGFTRPKPGTREEVFSTLTTEEGITMDYWLMKPKNFDPNKKYPIVFKVYGEPAGTTVKNEWGFAGTLYEGDMAGDGYIYCAIEGRGTPAPKGRAWRKSIYRNIGRLNIRDQALGAKALFKKYSWIDTSRVAVWGWSGGGATTLNLLFQYPEIYQTGIAIAAVTDQFTYDNIYQERYMGLKSENPDDFKDGSPIKYAKNLRGNLMYIHGTGDDNVHYQNAELLQNELILHGKQFSFMSYPNRSHSIREGDGTRKHLGVLFTDFLKENCPPGAK